MKLILLLVVSCLFLQNGKGAPTTAEYKFVTCKPGNGQANCVTQRAEVPWSRDLPTKLPASVGQYLNAKPVENESPEDNKVEEEETPVRSEDGESPDMPESDGGSGDYGSSGSGSPAAESETGSGESWTDNFQEDVGETKPSDEELEKDHLLST
ncbi:serglycin [Kryptolebias marmoratus]|uniref:serglycin n=1 Tax=Kryptolebias marmoratus TaxID=37003 RepID=UPI0007F89A5D|nr:serglycin [Kryptolebias marmoratus]